ncbi:MAG: hypothetical protein PWP23_527 [Candidatus Sumerlaeota bacterium]|nr:hypothetical protein [Candidatus Sumerlaeota bacterium]
MTDHESAKRQAISRLMREAASIFSQSNTPDIAPALPKMYAAVDLAGELHDKAPLVICEAHLASMNALCGQADDAIAHIERALNVVADNDVPVWIRNFATTKFVEIAILLHREGNRAQRYAVGLLQSAADEEGNAQQYLASVFNLAVLTNELLGRRDLAMALLSWIADEAEPDPGIIALQARRYYQKIASEYSEEERLTAVCEIEANRDYLLSEATNGFLPGTHATEFDA